MHGVANLPVEQRAELFRETPQRQLLLCTGDNYFCATSVFKQ
jgi:hypothetical protein